MTQTLSFIHNGQSYGDGATIVCGEITGDGSQWMPYAGVTLKNNSDAVVQVMAKAESADGSAFQFCLGVCAVGATHARGPVPIRANNETDLQIHYSLGTSIVTVTKEINVTVWEQEEPEKKISVKLILSNSPNPNFGRVTLDGITYHLYIDEAGVESIESTLQMQQYFLL